MVQLTVLLMVQLTVQLMVLLEMLQPVEMIEGFGGAVFDG